MCVMRDKVALCIYERYRFSRNVPPTPSRSPPGGGLPQSPPDSGQADSSHLPPLDPRERSSTLPKQPERGRSPCILDEVVPIPPSGALVVKKVPGAAEYPLPSTVPFFTILPSIHFQIPCPLPLPFSVIPPERVQVSWVAGNDLDMSLYVFFPWSQKFSWGWRN